MQIILTLHSDFQCLDACLLKKYEIGVMDNERKNSIRPEWIDIVSRYNKPDNLKSWWQVINSTGAYIIMWLLMIWSLNISYWITLALTIPAAGFLVRTFIIFHDCGHGSFFRSERLNTIVGVITGLLVFTPYHRWHRDHRIHHQTVGNLDKRGTGDVVTLTVDEYHSRSRWQRFLYRVYRHPIFLFGLAPLLLFVVLYRFPKKYMSVREHIYVHLTNLALAMIIFSLIMAIGWKAYLMIQLPVLYIATVHGVWLFYVQHQFRHVQWSDSSSWDYKNMALQGSSFFRLPATLNWFTGNIGYHHIHHLSPLIPNYNLKKCNDENDLFREIKPITFWSAFESLILRLWDEKRGILVSFRERRRAISPA
jgi:omega-6 fatty acid desaturase (delta-12 desaturase)